MANKYYFTVLQTFIFTDSSDEDISREGVDY